MYTIYWECVGTRTNMCMYENAKVNIPSFVSLLILCCVTVQTLIENGKILFKSMTVVNFTDLVRRVINSKCILSANLILIFMFL